MEETKKCKCCGRELPVSEFSRAGYGTLNTCKECVSKNKKAAKAKKRQERDFEKELADAKKMRLADFTARDLMEELANRGIDGEMSIPLTTYKKVSLASFKTSVNQ